MSLVLEMPAEPVEVLAPPPPDTTAADQAAELLDQVDTVESPAAETDRCPNCGGRGFVGGDPDDDSREDCVVCDGAGSIQAVQAEPPPADEPKPKKKRGRKKKAEQAAEEQSATEEVAAEEQPAAEVAAEQPAEPVAAPQSATPIATAKSDRTILDDIAFAEVQCEQAESVVLSCKEELKDAKKIYDAAVLRLRRLAQAVKNDSDRPLFKQPVSTLPGDMTMPPAVAPDPDLWRATPIAELGISPKLIEKLEEAGATTIGQLEDLRAQISTGREKWPRGIGKAKITEIEDALVEWLTKNRDSAVFGQGVVESPAIEAWKADAAGHWEDMSEQEQLDFICQRAVQLDPDEAVELEGDDAILEPKHPESRAFFESGYIAGQNGEAVSTCGWVPGIEQDDWIRGWLKAGKEADNEGIVAVDEAVIGGPAEEPAAEVDSLDDL